VLCSGGVDSATIAACQADRGEATELCFVDFGQAARHAERRSVAHISKHLDVSLDEVQIAGLAVPAAGEIAGRNLLLIAVAAAMRPAADLIFMGIHAGTGYRDCSLSFVELMQRVLDFHTDGTCRLVTPFVDWSKSEVVALARELNLPLELTHSCEMADEPCGRCRSCLDRAVLIAG
jgi:7-cyano-7-deazaguanine synthase